MADVAGHREAQPPPPARDSRNASLFLRTKLLPPRPVPELLDRPRLTDKLFANMAHPLTLVAANAGSGKTTLVADFVRRHAPLFVWYQLDHTDADPFVFLGYVTSGIKHVVEGFDGVTLSYLRQSADEMTRHPERAVDVLLNEILESVDRRFVLVLDDYHHLGAETSVHSMVDRLLAYLPDVMHVIIISRDIPPLSLARPRSQGQMVIIDRNDLLFTDEETQELFRRVFDLEMTTEQMVEYRQRTEGWITALQLVRQQAERRAVALGDRISTPTVREGDQYPDRKGGEREPSRALDLVEILRRSEQDIFDYFAEEVTAFEPEDVKRLLLRIALLDRVEAQVCASLYPDFNCRSILPALVRRNLFITVASDERSEEYRLHPLFQSFLQRRLRLEIGRAGISAEYARFADYFLALNKWESGVRYLIKAEEFERAAEVIALRGAEWLSSGALASLLAFAEALPATAIEKHPRALCYQAEVLRLRGEYDAALACLRRAVTLLQEGGDRQGEAEAMHWLATIARRRGETDAALALLDEAERLAAEDDPVRIRCGNTRGLCLTGVGDLAAAEREFRAALHSAEECGDEDYARIIGHNLGLPAMLRGDFAEALRWLRRMLRTQEGSVHKPRDATAHLNIARCHLFRGDFAACEKHLLAAIECSQLFNLTSLLGEIFEAYGNLYRESMDMARAAEFYERARRAYEEAGISLSHRELLEEQAIMYLQAGLAASARLVIDQLIRARSDEGNELGVQTSCLARGRILIAEGDLAGAETDLQRASAHFRKRGLHYYEAQAEMALAVCRLEREAEGEMLLHLRRAIDLAVSYDYEHWLQREVTQEPRLFAMPEAAALLPADVREQLSSEAKRPLKTASARPWPVALGESVASGRVTDLTIKLLGHVEIFRDPSHPLTGEVWNTRRARDIFCFIASRSHRRASKDIIVDTFWGEAEFDVVEKNFHPTISHIRKALNSRQAFKQNFLIYRDGDYQLNPDFTYSIDTEEFDQRLGEGEAARRARDFEGCRKAFEAAVALSRGEFMQGCYDSWVEEQRAYYRGQCLRQLSTLTDIAQRGGDWARSLELAQEILGEDPFREDIHCKAMRAHAALGNRMAIKDQLETLRSLLRKELGVEPSAETERLYRELVKGK
ncbi:MAG: tetratricopeptide repeat protein [Blastocatellia bacterium]|nr:tetratricopeptide repeat protein [Blastocatellia bacterium]